MSLVHPLWLVLLVLIPLGLLAARRWRGRARTYAVRFPALASVAAAAGMGPSRWRRAVAPTLLALAVLAVAVALARPQQRYRMLTGNGSIVLVLDHSGSMASSDVSPSRIQAAIAAANTLIDELPSQIKVGFIGFGSSADAVQAPESDHAPAKALLDAQQPGGGTATGPALALALRLLHGSDAHHPPSAIVLLSDGSANIGVDPTVIARQARGDHIAIDTVALGTPHGVLNEGFPYGTVAVPPDPALMHAIAADSGGRDFDAQTAERLSSIYRTLGNRLGGVLRERDLTVWVLLAAAVLLALAVLARTRSAVRIP